MRLQGDGVTSIALVPVEGYESAKEKAASMGRLGVKQIVFTDLKLLSSWVASLGEHPESLQKLSCRQSPV